LKLTTDRHEASRGLFATAELLVQVISEVGRDDKKYVRITLIMDSHL